MPNKRIHLCLAHMSEAGLEQKYIQEAFETNWVVPLGPNVNGFEKDLEKFVNGVAAVETCHCASLQGCFPNYCQQKDAILLKIANFLMQFI